MSSPVSEHSEDERELSFKAVYKDDAGEERGGEVVEKAQKKKGEPFEKQLDNMVAAIRGRQQRTVVEQANSVRHNTNGRGEEVEPKKGCCPWW